MKIGKMGLLPNGKPSGLIRTTKYTSHPTKDDLKNLASSYIRVNSPHHDDAAFVAKCSKNGLRLNTHQVRILRALKSGKEMGRLDLAVVAGPGKNYGETWLNNLWDLKNRKLVSITSRRVVREQHFQKITTLGKKLIDVCERIAKV